MNGVELSGRKVMIARITAVTYKPFIGAGMRAIKPVSRARPMSGVHISKRTTINMAIGMLIGRSGFNSRN